MVSRTAKIASSIVAGVLAGAPLAVPRNAANAAECLTEPSKDGTRGQHWYYRIEHGTKRHCWYLRDQDGNVSQTATSDDSAEAPKAAAEASENPPRSIEDAHAEYPMPQARGSIVATSAPVPALPQANAQGSAVAERWPSPDTAIAPAAVAPTATAQAVTAQAAPPAAADATNSAPATNTAADATADTPPPAPAAATPAPAAKPSVSLQMLFAVIGGALGLAGLTASVVYRLGRRRQRRLATAERRAVLWEGVETGPKPPWVEPLVEEPPAPRPPRERKPAQSAKAQERYEKIEEILEQLVRQAQQSDA